MIGHTLANYRIDREIGRGSMAVVYEAVQLSLNRTVALKVLAGPLATNQEFVQRFEREAHAAARLNHPNITQIYDFGMEEHVYFIAMEYCPGQTLERLLSPGEPVPLPRAGGIVRQLAAALACAHAAGIVHRDVKPSNVMMMDGDTIKLMDLGIARALDDLDLTTPGSAVGTLRYMSPEQASGGPCDARSDVYSLGLLCHQVLTGTLPPAGNDGLDGPDTPDASAGCVIPVPVRNVVSRALSRDTRKRFRDAAGFLAAWEEAFQKASCETLIVSLPPAIVDPHPGPAHFLGAANRACRSRLSLRRPRRLIAAVSIASLCLLTAVGASLPGIRVTTDPPGAIVSMDDNRIGISPLEIRRMVPGSHTVAVSRKGFKPVSKTILLGWRSRAHVAIDLPPIKGWMKVTSTPSAASVWLDGKRRGDTPLYIDRLSLGAHRVRLTKSGYRPREETISVTGKTLLPVAFSLVPQSSELRVESQPPGADVYIDGRFAGTTPVTGHRVSPGAHVVELRSPGRRTFRKEIFAKPETPLDISTELAVDHGTILVESLPSGASVLVDEKFKGHTPLTLRDLPCKDYTLQVEEEGYETRKVTVAVEPGSTRRVPVALTPALGSLLVIASPGEVDVFLDGKLAGTASPALALDDVRVGRREICLVRTGYRVFRETVEVEKGNTFVMEADLEEDRPRAWQPASTIRLANGRVIQADILYTTESELTLRVEKGTISISRHLVADIYPAGTAPSPPPPQ